MSSIWTIRRSATDTKLTGLCGGVAQHWGVDPVLVRVGCALLALSGGIGVVLYVAGWLLIPVEGRDRAPVDDFFGATGRRWPKEVWVVLVVIACIAALSAFSSISPVGIGPALVLAVIWYFGFYRGRSKAAAPPPGSPGGADAHPLDAPTLDAPTSYPGQAAPFVRYPGRPTPFKEAAEAWRLRIEEARRSTAPSPPAPGAPAPGAPAPVGFSSPPPARGQAQAPVFPAPPPASARSAVSDPPARDEILDDVRAEPVDPEVSNRQAFLAHADPVGLYTEPSAPVVAPVRRSRCTSARRLRLVSLIVLGLVLGTLGILDGQGLTVSLAGYLGAALLVVGLTLVAATWCGRPRGLIATGLLLVIAVALTSFGGPVTRLSQLGQWDAAARSYTQVAELPTGGDVRDVGELQVDLSALPLTQDTAYRAHVGAGTLEVTVPADVNVVINYTVGLGAVQAFDAEVVGGTDLASTVNRPTPADPGRPTLTLDLSMDQGWLEVRQ